MNEHLHQSIELRSRRLVLRSCHDADAAHLCNLIQHDPPFRVAAGMTGHGLASARWGQRLTTEAFAMVLDLARALNLITVQTNIEQSNVASWRLWAAHDATLTPHENGRYTCEIQLASQGWRTGSVRGAVG